MQSKTNFFIANANIIMNFNGLLCHNLYYSIPFAQKFCILRLVECVRTKTLKKFSHKHCLMFTQKHKMHKNLYFCVRIIKLF